MTEAMREQFEAWMSDGGAYPKAVERNQFDGYKYMPTHTAWVTWQAALRSPAVAGLVEALEEFAPAVPLTKREQQLAAALAQYATLAGEGQ